MWNVESRYGPVMEVFEVEGTRERRLVIGYRMGDTSNFFRLVTFLCPWQSHPKPIRLVPFPTSTISTPSTPLANMLASPLCFFLLSPHSKLFLRTICQWDNYYLSIPQPSTSHQRSPDRAFYLSGNERGLFTFLSPRQPLFPTKILW